MKSFVILNGAGLFLGPFGRWVAEWTECERFAELSEAIEAVLDGRLEGPIQIVADYGLDTQTTLASVPYASFITKEGL